MLSVFLRGRFFNFLFLLVFKIIYILFYVSAHSAKIIDKFCVASPKFMNKAIIFEEAVFLFKSMMKHNSSLFGSSYLRIIYEQSKGTINKWDSVLNWFCKDVELI